MSGWSTISTSGLPPRAPVSDLHPDVSDDLEHLPDAVVRVAEESPHRRLAVAEDELAGRGAEDAHLVFDVGGDHPIGTQQLPSLRVEQLRRDHEQRQTLGPRAALPLDALRARKDAVDDVLGRVVGGPGDEALGPREVPVPVVGEGGAGAPEPDVGARIGLGEHHRHGPVALEDELGESLLLLVAIAVQHRDDGGDELTAHGDGRIGAEDELRCGPAQ